MQLIVIAHNIRSTHNIGSIFRTADGFGIKHIYLTGYSPYPETFNDPRLPHIRQKLTNQIHKTALDAEKNIPFTYFSTPEEAINLAKKDGYTIAALEQTPDSIMLPNFKNRPQKIALLLGEEVHGIEPQILKLCDLFLEIPMVGKKESFNVSVATGIALYELTKKINSSQIPLNSAY